MDVAVGGSAKSAGSGADGASGSGSGLSGASVNEMGMDRLFSVDAASLEKLRADKPWVNDAKYFKRVVVSGCAVMKMLCACSFGRRKGN